VENDDVTATDRASGPRTSWSFAATTASVGDSRDAVRRWLTDLRCDEPLVDDMVLMASELVTNALEHASGASSMSVSLDDGMLCLAVRHHGSAGQLPEVDTWGPAHPEAFSGRGLGIVAALADEVRVRTDGPEITIEVRRHVGPASAGRGPS